MKNDFQLEHIMMFSRDVVGIIYDYLAVYKIAEWFNKEHIKYLQFEENPHPAAMEFIKTQHKIEWYWLSKNSSDTAVDFLLANKEKINRKAILSNSNPRLIPLIKNIMEQNSCLFPDDEIQQNTNVEIIELSKKYTWNFIYMNPGAIDLILQSDLTKINWDRLSENPHPKAIKLLKSNFTKINWFTLHMNPSAMEILKDNTGMINWRWLCSNPSSDVVKFLKENKHMIMPYFIKELAYNTNPDIIEFIKDKPSYHRYLDQNPGIFELTNDPRLIDELLTC